MTETIQKPNIDELMKKLINENFNGKEPEWREAEWTETRVLCAIADKNWYYRKGDMIYVQEKKAPNRTHCYHCNSEIEVVGQKCSVHASNMTLSGRDVRTKLIPYCPKCESKPSESGFIRE